MTNIGETMTEHGIAEKLQSGAAKIPSRAWSTAFPTKLKTTRGE
jgi:hypothetical protein